MRHKAVPRASGGSPVQGVMRRDTCSAATCASFASKQGLEGK